MGNLSITATSVFPGSGAVKETGIAGEAVTAGQVVYKDATTGKFGVADNNSMTAGVRSAYGIALNSAAANQSLVVQKKGNIVIGATVVVGESYYLSDTPGALGLESDLASGEYSSYLGTGITTTTINLDIKNSGVAVP